MRTATDDVGDCLTEDDLLALGSGKSLADAPHAEAHLAACPTCSALLASIVRASPRQWGDLAGTTFGPYRLDAQIGAGGMGAVYRAFDPRLGRAIAVKLMHAARGDGAATEARAAAAINHPNVVAIHDVVVDNGVTGVAMELVEGETLRSAIARGAIARDRARALAIEIAAGLAAAHARGVVHRDLKPENVVIGDGRLRILDFGLAKLGDTGALDDTEPGSIQGTAGYMAPEQARGESVDARADIFATGAIVYEMVTGKRAFDGASHADRLTAVLRDTPPLDDLGDLSPIVARCLAKEPRDRFQSAADLGWALDHLAAPAIPPPPARAPVSRRAILAGAGAAALAGAGGFALGRRGGGGARVAARPVFHQLTFRTGRMYTARFTPDGARVVYGAAWEDEALRPFALDLVGGGSRVLDVPSGDIAAVSSRGAIAVNTGRRFIEHQSASGRLAIVPPDGGAPRPIADDIQEADFAPDGSLAVIRRGRERFQLELPLGTTLVETDGWMTHPRVSPDGKRVAFLEHPHTNDDSGALVVVDVASRARRTIGADWNSIAGVAWDPGGDAIWFTAARTGAYCQVHVAPLAGAVRTVAQTTGRLRLHDLAHDRRALVSVDTWRLRLLVRGRDGVERDRSHSWVSYVTDISDDGDTLVVGEVGEEENEITGYVVPVGDGKPLRVGDGVPLALSPSRRRVAAMAYDRSPILVAYATDSASRETIATAAPVRSARWIDDASLVVADRDRVWRVAPAAAPQPLTEPGVTGDLAIDAARRRCAFVDPRDRLIVVDLATGDVRPLGMYPRAVVCGWLADPDVILVRSTTTPIDIVRVDPATAALAPYREIAPPPVGLKAVDAVVISRDGAVHAYSAGHELSALHLMTLES
jgi:hypothetical protein